MWKGFFAGVLSTLVILGILGFAMGHKMPRLYKKIDGFKFAEPTEYHWNLILAGAESGWGLPSLTVGQTKMVADALGAKAFMPTATGYVFSSSTPAFIQDKDSIAYKRLY